jgi:hypothetical protein
MANFTHLKALKVTADSTIEYEMPELGEKAVLTLRYERALTPYG